MNAIQNLILCLKGPKASEKMWEFFLKLVILPVPIKSLIIIIMKTLIFVRTLISKHKIPYPGAKEADSSWKVKVKEVLSSFPLICRANQLPGSRGKTKVREKRFSHQIYQ